jgi:hypothetical protein
VLVLKVEDAAGNTGSGDVVFTLPLRPMKTTKKSDRAAVPRTGGSAVLVSKASSPAPVHFGAPTGVGQPDLFGQVAGIPTLVPRDPQTEVIAPSVGTSGLTNRPPPGYTGLRGRLVRAGRALGEPTYRLDLVQSGLAMPTTYLVAVRGRRPELEANINRVIEVWGRGYYDGSLRANVLRVERVFPNP